MVPDEVLGQFAKSKDLTPRSWDGGQGRGQGVNTFDIRRNKEKRMRDAFIGRCLPIIVASIAIMVLMFAACSRKVEVDEGTLEFLRVENASNQTIFVAISIGSRSFRFGVVTPGNFAAVGFGEFNRGVPIKIEWEVEGKPGIERTALDTKSLTIPPDTEVVLLYEGETRWSIKLEKL